MLVARDVADTVDSTPREVDGRIGQQLGHYLLEARIGSGGMGTVYRARDVRNGVQVAVKVLFPELAAIPDVLTRFMREAAALEALDHPGIVRGLTSGSYDGVSYLVMELIEGESLESRLQRGVKLEESARLLAAIADALAAAHARGIVHRDLKPANVLIARDGTVKLVDFGVARFDVADGTLTHTDAVLGTFNYMAPEQRLRSRDVDHRADLFALGVILYRALTGTLPIGAYERPSAMNREVPRDYDALVAKLLASDPRKRFADAEATARALAAIPKVRRLRRAGFALAALVALACGVAAWAIRPSPAATPLTPQARAVAPAADTLYQADAATPASSTPVVPILAPRDEPQNQLVDGPGLEPKLEVEETPNVKASANLRKKQDARKIRFSGEDIGSKNAVPTPPKPGAQQALPPVAPKK
jgi:serine/threonine-protein kinase